MFINPVIDVLYVLYVVIWMALSIVLPGFGKKTLSTKDAIISLLSVRHPLSLKEIFSDIKKEYAISASYQAVHKMLHSLEGERVVVKNGSKFSLSAEWILNVKAFSARLQSYSNYSLPSDWLQKEVLNLEFHSMVELIRFVIWVFNDQFPNPDKKSRVCLLGHPWLPVGLDPSDLEQVKKIFQVPYYGLYHGAGVLDQFGNTFTQNMGKQSIHQVTYPADGDLVIEGDYVAQIFYPTEFKQRLNALFEKTKSMEQFDMAKVYSLYMENVSIKMVITRNPILAEQLRTEGINLFPKSVHANSFP